MNRQEIRELNDKIHIEKENYSKILNEINYNFWPIDAKWKKFRKYSSFLVKASIIAIFMIVLCFLLSEEKNEYKIAAYLSVPVLSFIASTVVDIIFRKKHNKMTNEWNTNLKKPDSMKEIINTLSIKAVNVMLDSFDNRNEIEEKVGTSYEDVLEYYKNNLDK